MSRDNAGVYSLPAQGNPTVPDTVISSSGWANPTLDDLANEMTNSLDRFGRGGMEAPFHFEDGDETGPGISWTNEPGTGLYRLSSGDMRVTVQGTDQFRWAPTAQMWNVADTVWYDVANAKYFSNDGVDKALLLFGSDIALSTIANGIEVGVADAFGRVNLRTETNVEGLRLEAADAASSLVGLVEGVGVQLVGTKTGGASSVLFAADPDGESGMGYDGGERIAATELGSRTAGTTFDFGQQTDNSILMRLTNLIGGLRYIVSSVTGKASIQQLDNLNVFEDNWIEMDRDGAVALNFAGAEKVKTAAGGAVVTGNIAITAALPTSNNEATRKDYVDAVQADVNVNSAKLNEIQGNIADQRIQVENMMMLSGRQGSSGDLVTVTFDTPFTSVPAVTMVVVSAANANNSFGWTRVVTTTGFTATVPAGSGLPIDWIAMGTNNA